MDWLKSIFDAITSALATLRLYVKPSTAESAIEKDKQSNADEAQKIQDGRP